MSKAKNRYFIIKMFIIKMFIKITEKN